MVEIIREGREAEKRAKFLTVEAIYSQKSAQTKLSVLMSVNTILIFPQKPGVS